MLTDLSISKILKYLKNFDLFVSKVKKTQAYLAREEAAQSDQKNNPEKQTVVDCHAQEEITHGNLDEEL